MTRLTDQIAAAAEERGRQSKELGSQNLIAFVRGHLKDADGGVPIQLEGELPLNPIAVENGKLMVEYLRAHSLKWTIEDLESAYAALKPHFKSTKGAI